MKSPVADPFSTLMQFNRQFQLNKQEREAVDWAWPLEQGTSMFNIIQTYTMAAQAERLKAGESYRLQKTGGSIMSMLT